MCGYFASISLVLFWATFLYRSFLTSISTRSFFSSKLSALFGSGFSNIFLKRRLRRGSSLAKRFWPWFGQHFNTKSFQRSFKYTPFSSASCQRKHRQNFSTLLFLGTLRKHFLEQQLWHCFRQDFCSLVSRRPSQFGVLSLVSLWDLVGQCVCTIVVLTSNSKGLFLRYWFFGTVSCNVSVRFISDKDYNLILSKVFCNRSGSNFVR